MYDRAPQAGELGAACATAALTKKDCAQLRNHMLPPGLLLSRAWQEYEEGLGARGGQQHPVVVDDELPGKGACAFGRAASAGAQASQEAMSRVPWARCYSWSPLVLPPMWAVL